MLKDALLCCLKWLGFSIAIFIVVFAVLISVARAVVPLLNDKRVFFEKWTSRAIHQPVHIGHVRIRGWSFDPTLRFDDVIIQNPKQAQSLLKINHFSISINLIHSLLHWKLLPGHLFISGAQVDIYHNKNGRLNVKGVFDLHGKKKHADLGYMKDIIVWMLTQSEISLQHINVNFHTADGHLLPIKNLRLKVINNVLRHQMTGVASLAQTIPTYFRFVVNLKSTDLDASHFSADIYFQANNLIFSQWVNNHYLQQYFKKLNLTHGIANVQSWLKWRGKHLNEFQAVIKSKNVRLNLAQKRKNILINHFNANVYWQRYRNGWSFSANHVQLYMNEKTWPEHTFGLRIYNADKYHPERILFASQFIRLHDIQVLAENIGYWPKSVQKMYEKLKLHGDLYNLDFMMSLLKGKRIFYRVRTEFKKLGFSSWNKLPATSGLTGFIDATPQGGELTLSSRQASVNVSQIFNHPLFFNQLNLVTSWKHSDGGWQVSTPSLTFKNAMGNAQSTFVLTVPSHGSPMIKMATNFKVLNVRLVKDYIPTRILKTKLKMWLSRAFLAGKISHGTMKLQGPIADFPFDDKRGRFHLQADVEDLTLKYLPNWPAMYHIDGSLAFDNRSMTVRAHHGVIAGNPLNHIQAKIPDLQKPGLTVTGHSKSNLKKGAQFLKKVPLKVSKQLHNTVLDGPMTLNIKLYIPLYKTNNNKSHVIASGDIAVENGTMQLKAWNTKFIHIKGVYHFVNNNVSAKHVTALLYGLPAVCNISTLDARTPSPVLQVEVGGQLSMTSLQKRFKLPVLTYMQGITTYHALVKIRDENSPLATSLSLMSDLNGITMTLPPPYNKTANQTKRFFVTMKIIHNKLLTVMLRYGNDFSIATRFNRFDNKLKFISGELLFGPGQARLQQLPGLLIDGKIERLAWSQWQKYLGTYLKSSRLVSKIAWSHDTDIRRIKLQIDKLLLFKQTLHHTYLDLAPKSDGWSVTVKNPIISGNMYIPNHRDQCWYGHFNRLYLPKFKTKNKSDQRQQKFDLHKIPPFYLTFNDFRYGGKDLGQIDIKSTPLQTGLKINQLTVKNNLFRISAIGTWQNEQGQQHCGLFGRFDSSNLGSVLKNWGITSALEGGGGFANFVLRWPGSPREFSTTKLSGGVNINFQNGRVSQVSNGAESTLGLGRLLNLFSLQTLPLLPVKLAHLAKKGFAFNLMKGDFKLNHGNATTKNASIVGSVAWVRVYGDIQFARKNYDLQLNIVPNITSSLPLIVSIAGGPLAGAIAWVANKILGPQVGKTAQINYRVTGSWNKPSIIKIPAPAETNTHGT